MNVLEVLSSIPCIVDLEKKGEMRNVVPVAHEVRET